MKKKLISIVVFFMLVLICSFSSTTLAKKSEFTKFSTENSYKHFNGDEYDFVATAGPIEHIFDIIEIEWIEGDPELIQEIEQLLDPTYSLKNVGVNLIEFSNLSFTITYNWGFRYRPLYRYSFFTTFANEERYFLSYLLNSIPYLGKTHSTTIKGLTGDIMVVRFFRPLSILNSIGEFHFTGEFEEVTIIK
ncbi:hypothetical protein AYK21_04915 [Thermoplasmatales archaeon SG8-52-2]|nr:MAG: hypothetical protein AYK21_04915 [Thermoplasmatales archaeon SG8-52-2]